MSIKLLYVEDWFQTIETQCLKLVSDMSANMYWWAYVQKFGDAFKRNFLVGKFIKEKHFLNSTTPSYKDK